jgi:hypothetical protein
MNRIVPGFDAPNVIDEPATTQLLAATQATPFSVVTAMPAGTGGCGAAVTAVPFQMTANAREAPEELTESTPTTMQYVADLQDVPVTDWSVVPLGE